MEQKIFDSERNILECLWNQGDCSAKELAEQLEVSVGWSKPTTYTVIRKCVTKGLIQRSEPNFICHALVSREEVCKQETEELITRNYGGSPDRLVASLLDQKKLTKQDIEQLKDLIHKLG